MHRPALALTASMVFACADPVVTGVGQFGAPIERIADANRTPRLLISTRQDDQASGAAGPCARLCESDPHACDGAGDCAAVLLDSGSPFTVLAGDTLAAGRESVEVRRGTPQALDATVVRFRFEGAPVLRVPASFDLGGWDWTIGSTRTGLARVGAVIGGNVMRHFAVRVSPSPASVTFHEVFPGSEEALADLGWVFARLSYPNRLIGTRADDVCFFDDLDCDLSQIPILDDSREIGFEATRMLVDACFAPPPCALDWVAANPARDECELRRGDEPDRCRDADDPDFGGKGMSFVVATGSPDIVLFEDSLERMVGGTPLPACSDRLTAAHPICDTGQTSTVQVPGYAPIAGARHLRARALALVEGNRSPAGAGPCTRLQRRLAAAQLSCEALDERGRPFRSLRNSDIDPQIHAVVVGEIAWDRSRQSNESLWLDVHAVPETSGLARNLRREVGSDAVEPDGLLGSVLLEHTELVLDYTETEEAPGLRLGCLSDPSRCRAYPACSGLDGTEGPGRASCCHGMPPALISKALSQNPEDAAGCCAALDRPSLAAVQATGVCQDVVER